jgi:hypothetical protein
VQYFITNKDKNKPLSSVGLVLNSACHTIYSSHKMTLQSGTR